MVDRDEHHPERDIADDDVETFVRDAVERLARLPTARPASLIVDVDGSASQEDVYRRLRSALDDEV